ncbi:MAG: hypothetical protein H6967_01110 [Chromatiaceae bacterium]|nr:hypothetical protein [Chromatiaceae bacterium]
MSERPAWKPGWAGATGMYGYSGVRDVPEWDRISKRTTGMEAELGRRYRDVRRLRFSRCSGTGQDQ